MKNKFGILMAGFSVLLTVLIFAAMMTDGTGKKALPVSNLLVSTNAAPAVVLDETLIIAPRDPLYFGLDHVPVLQTPIFGRVGQPVWQLLAALIYITLAYYGSRFVDFFTHAQLRKWAERTETKMDDLLLDILHGPITLLTFVILLHYGLHLCRLLSTGLKVLVAVSLTFLAVRCVDLLIAYWRERTADRGADKSFDAMLVPVIRKSLKAFIIVVAVLLTSDNLGLNIKSVLASLSIGGLALGLAAQDTLSNIFGALGVFIDKPFSIGDRIKLDTVDGEVESIGLRSTRIRNLDGYLVTIPNKTMGNAIITNVSRRPAIKTEVNLGLTYDTSLEKLKTALSLVEKTYREHPLTKDVLICFNQFGDSALNINIIHWCNTAVYTEYLAAMQDINLRLKQRMEKEHIEFAYPSRTVYIKNTGNPTPNVTAC